MREIHLRALFDTFIEDQNSHLLDLVDLSHLTVQLETQSGLGANDQALSPANHGHDHVMTMYLIGPH